MSDTEEIAFLRKAFEVARRAREQGNHPFGAILVENREVLIERGNSFSGNDRTAHAELLLAREAAQRFSPERLAQCTVYVSAEPCAMCAGAIYWAGIGRVVYGQSEKSLLQITGNHGENPTLDLPCRRVFEAGQRDVKVIGPLLENEAEQLQNKFWNA